MAMRSKKHVSTYLKSEKLKVNDERVTKPNDGILNIDRRKTFGSAAPIVNRASTATGDAKFSTGGHIERNEFKVERTAKPPPPVDNSQKEMMQKYLDQKEQDLIEFQQESEERRRLEEEQKLKHEQDIRDEEERKRNAILEEIKKNDRDSKIKWDFSEKVYYIMKDVNNPVLLDKSTELDFNRKQFTQFRYSQGDPGALEQEKLKYRLSKTNEFDMADKLSGEQNRVVYDQVRPSYFGDKSEKPLFDTPGKRIVNSAGNDITLIRSHTDVSKIEKLNLKDTQNKSKLVSLQTQWETTLREVPGARELTRNDNEESLALSASTDKPITSSKKYSTELYSMIDPIKFRNLKKTFEHYAALGRTTNFKNMDSIQFQSLLKNNSLFFKGFDAKEADIVLFKENTKRFITFDEFCRIIIELGELKYKTSSVSSTSEKVKLYLKEFVFIREKNAFKHKTDTYEDWLLELETSNMIEVLKSWKPTFKTEFMKYATKSIMDNEPVMDSKIMHKYCRDNEIIPNLLNRAACFKMFKECQRSDSADIDKEFLTFSEYMEFISFIGIYYFTQNEKHYPKLDNIEKKVDAMFRWVEKKIKN